MKLRKKSLNSLKFPKTPKNRQIVEDLITVTTLCMSLVMTKVPRNLMPRRIVHLCTGCAMVLGRKMGGEGGVVNIAKTRFFFNWIDLTEITSKMPSWGCIVRYRGGGSIL